MFVQFLIHESSFYQCLAIIKRSVHFESGDILSQSSELFFLYFADFSFRVEYIYMNTFHTQKTVGNGTSRITGSRYQYIHILLAFFLDKVAQQTCHKTAAYIFESQSRSVEKFQRIDVIRHFHQRYIKAQCVIHYLSQGIGRDVFAKESIGYTISNLLKRQSIYRIVKILGKRLDSHWHEKSSVGGKPFYYSFLQRSHRRLFICTIVFHWIFF